MTCKGFPSGRSTVGGAFASRLPLAAPSLAFALACTCAFAQPASSPQALEANKDLVEAFFELANAGKAEGLAATVRSNADFPLTADAAVERRRSPDGTSAQFNQFRVEDGLLTEHWGVYQDVPPVRQNGNTFFGFGRGPAADYSR